MSYIICKKCGCQMSDKSEACPVCGAIVEENVSQDEILKPVSSETVKTDANGKEKKKSLLIIIIVALIVVAAIAVIVLTNNKQAEKEQVPAEQQTISQQSSSEGNNTQFPSPSVPNNVVSFFHNEILNKFPISMTCKEIKDKYGLNEQDFSSQKITIIDHERLQDGITYSLSVCLKGDQTGFHPYDSPQSICLALFILDKETKQYNGEIIDALIQSFADYTDIFHASFTEDMLKDNPELEMIIAEDLGYTCYKNDHTVSITGFSATEIGFVPEEEYDVISLTIMPLDFFYKKSEHINNSSSAQYVVINATELRLRYGPSMSAETYKWGDGSNRHPNKGEKYRYLGESGDFYKIDYKGVELWVSKQFTYLE